MGMGMGSSQAAIVLESENEEDNQYYGYGDEFYRDEWKDALCINEFILSYLPSVRNNETGVVPHYFEALHQAINSGGSEKDGKELATRILKQEKFELLRKQNDPGLSEREYDIVRQIHDVGYVYEDLCGFSAYTHYNTYRLFQTFMHFAWYAVVHFKQYFRRQRPNFVFPELSPMINVPSHPSFPSGHATQGYLVALMLSEVLPNRTTHFSQALLDLGKQVGENREWAGVHYRSDTLAGQTLAKHIWDHVKDGIDEKKMSLPYTCELIKRAQQEWYENESSQLNSIGEDASTLNKNIRDIYKQISE